METKNESPVLHEQRGEHECDSASDNSKERTTMSQFLNPHHSHANDPDMTFNYGAASGRAESPTGQYQDEQTCSKKTPSEQFRSEIEDRNMGMGGTKISTPPNEQDKAYQELEKVLENQQIHQWFRGLNLEAKRELMTTSRATARAGADHMRDKDRYGLEALLEEPPDFQRLMGRPKNARGQPSGIAQYMNEPQLPNFRPSGYNFEPVQPTQPSSMYTQSRITPSQVPPTRPRTLRDPPGAGDYFGDIYVGQDSPVFPTRGRSRESRERGNRRRPEQKAVHRDLPTGVLGYFDAKKGTWSSFKTRF